MSRSNTVVGIETKGLVPNPIYEVLRAETTDNEQNAIRDYSGGQEFVYTATVSCRIHRLIVVIGDVGVITPATYGALAELTNGILVAVHRGGAVFFDLLDGLSIKKNMDWQRYSYDVVINDQGAGNAGFIGCRWTFDRSGRPLRLAENDQFVVTAQDSFVGLTDHYFSIQGYAEL